MAGVEITEQDIRDGSYSEKVRPISAMEWISNANFTVLGGDTFDHNGHGISMFGYIRSENPSSLFDMCLTLTNIQ